MKKNLFHTKKKKKKKKKARNRQYPTETITDADYVYDLAVLANMPAQTKPLLRSR